jgi:hypothetical protein
MSENDQQQNYLQWIRMGRTLSEGKGLSWDLAPGPDGYVSLADAWNISVVCGAPARPNFRLNDLGHDAGALEVINAERADDDLPPIMRGALPYDWQDFLKAGVAVQAFSEMNTPAHVIGSYGRAARVLATCAAAKFINRPWDLTADVLRYAVKIAGEAQKSGQLQRCLVGLVRTVIDARRLCANGPFSHLIESRHGSRNRGKTPVLIDRLQDRNDPEKLPEAEVFWELAEIVFTKKPVNFFDRLRFAQTKLLFLCGLRIGETALVPMDWASETEHLARDRCPAGEAGGITKSLKLHYFAFKNQEVESDSVELIEGYQHVPVQFEAPLREALDDVVRLTAPLRVRLKQQIETGRQLPEFQRSYLISASEAYTRLTGNPIAADFESQELVDKYKETHDPRFLIQIADEQAKALREGVTVNRNQTFYWSHLRSNSDFPPFRSADGSIIPSGTRLFYARSFLLVGDLEDWLSRTQPSKASDVRSIRVEGGREIPLHKLLFIRPKRATVEQRDSGICDVIRVSSIGRILPADLTKMFAQENGLFARYGSTERSRKFTLNSHSLRHSQNTALFLAGVSDAVITKRFGRRSVAQSYVYDHRSLSERLEAISLPDEASWLPERARTAAKMIIAKAATGPIVDEFWKIRRTSGELAAFEYLAAEADGFHTTPYGHCLNGFTQEPCPKHLQCFGGCNHLLNTGLDQHTANLRLLAGKLEIAIKAISERRPGPGRDNQLRSATTHLANLRLLLASSPGQRPFPEGPDLSRPIGGGTVFDA